MKFKLDKTSSFFSPTSSQTANTQASCGVMEQDRKHIEATLIIQRWWRELRMKKHAAEVYNMAMLEQEKKDSFSKLEQFILTPDTLCTTQKLLTQLEQLKSVVLPSYTGSTNTLQTSRLFLSAYMISMKSELIFETPSEIDVHLLSLAEAMLHSLEELCAFINKFQQSNIAITHTPLAEKTPSIDKMIAHLNNNELLAHDLLMEGKAYFEIFHHTQRNYSIYFYLWEAENRRKLVTVLINKYMDIETHRFKALHSLDPRMLELCEGYGKQLKTLRDRILFLLGEQGNSMLNQVLKQHQSVLEENKWAFSPTEALMHEKALNPHRPLPKEAYLIQPQKNLDTAINALTSNPELILGVLEDIRNQLIKLTPQNKQQENRLQQSFDRQAMQAEIELLGLHDGLYKIITLFINEIQNLSAPQEQDLPRFRDYLHQQLNTGAPDVLLKESLFFIYYKISQINFEKNNFLASHMDMVSYEQQNFQARLSKKQFSLDFTFRGIDKLIETPSEYRLSQSLLCSKYIGSYVTNALLLTILQESEIPVLRRIPETFYLDRLRIVAWHAQYQKLVYTATALGYMEELSRNYGLTLAPDVLKQEKNRLIQLLNANLLKTPADKADDLILALTRLLEKENKKLSVQDEQCIKSLIEHYSVSSNHVAAIINKRFGDYLSPYLFKGFPPQKVPVLINRYGLDIELKKLGQELYPALHLHRKVHGAFYQQRVEQQLWKPLFTALRQTKKSESPPELMQNAVEETKFIRMYLHKLAFVLGGLSLIQQTMVYSDMNNLNQVMKRSELKKLADSSGLIEMIKDPYVTKEMIQNKLMEMMKQVAEKYKIPYEEAQQADMLRMLRLAKEERSPASNSFLNEITSLLRKTIIEGKEENYPNNLTAEFKEQISFITSQIKTCMKKIRSKLLPEDENPEATINFVMRSGRISSFNM